MTIVSWLIENYGIIFWAVALGVFILWRIIVALEQRKKSRKEKQLDVPPEPPMVFDFNEEKPFDMVAILKKRKATIEAEMRTIQTEGKRIQAEDMQLVGEFKAAKNEIDRRKHKLGTDYSQKMAELSTIEDVLAKHGK